MRVTGMRIVDSSPIEVSSSGTEGRRNGGNVEMDGFSKFYETEFRPVTGLAYALTGSRTAAEELAQDGFASAYRRWDTVGGYDDPGAWVRRVVVNACRSWGRKTTAELKAMTRLRNRRGPLPSLAELDYEFWAAVRALPHRQSQAIALHYLDDLSIETIAEILDCAPGTVKRHLHRGRQALSVSLNINETSNPGSLQSRGHNQ